MPTHSPTVDADHHDARHVEANAAGHHRIGGRQVQRARLVHFAVVLEGHRRFGPVQSERDGHERHQAGQQPNGDDGADGHASRHPPAVPVRMDGSVLMVRQRVTTRCDWQWNWTWEMGIQMVDCGLVMAIKYAWRFFGSI